MTEDTIELTLNSPITEEQWDAITDVDFDNTDRISFHTKHGKEVEFIKHIRGKWAGTGDSEGFGIFVCDTCGKFAFMKSDFCPNCGADMRQREEQE